MSSMRIERIAFFCDHTSGAGGGEHYAASLIHALVERYDVDLLVRADRFLPDPAFFRVTFGSDITHPRLTARVMDSPRDVRGYDLLINLSHFAVLPPWARRNLLVVFFPQLQTEWASQYDAILTISRYSAGWIGRYWGAHHVVVAAPAVDATRFEPGVKEQTIVSVGRFFDVPDGNNKNHPLMVRAFKALCNRGLDGWRLVLAGSASEDHAAYLARVRDEAAGYPIDIVTDPSFERLRDLYGRASIYWHAAGLTDDGLTATPAAAEHFGIVIVEAMASGCVPVVADTGGAVEIVTEPEAGLRCDGPDQLVEKTWWLSAHPGERREMAGRARSRAQDYAPARFAARVHALIDTIADEDPAARADFFLRDGNHRHAQTLFMEAIDRYPETAAPYLGLAECCYRQGHRELMLAALKRALEIEPEGAAGARIRPLVARVEEQRSRFFDVLAGTLFGEDYFERGRDAGINEYTAYSGESWSGAHAEIIAAAFAPTACLEIGCAKGEFVTEMRRRGVRSVGTDVSQYSVAQAPADLRGRALVASRISAIPFAADSFDLVVAIEVLEHVPPDDVEDALRELWRVSRNFVFITVQNTTAAAPEHFFSDVTHATMKPLAWWQERFRAAGFEVIPIELPLGEFRDHQIVAQVAGKQVTVREDDIAATWRDAERRARALSDAGEWEQARRVLEPALNLFNLLAQEGRAMPALRKEVVTRLAECYRRLGADAQAAAIEGTQP